MCLCIYLKKEKGCNKVVKKIIALLVIVLFVLFPLKKTSCNDIVTIKKTVKVSREQRYKIIHTIGEITFYCKCPKCTGKNDGITKSGKIATPYKTVALPINYPFNTIVKIHDDRLKDYVFICEDRGGVIKEINGIIKIDVFVNNHNEALKLGKFVSPITLWVPKEGSK